MKQTITVTYQAASSRHQLKILSVHEVDNTLMVVSEVKHPGGFQDGACTQISAEITVDTSSNLPMPVMNVLTNVSPDIIEMQAALHHQSESNASPFKLIANISEIETTLNQGVPLYRSDNSNRREDGRSAGQSATAEPSHSHTDIPECETALDWRRQFPVDSELVTMIQSIDQSAETFSQIINRLPSHHYVQHLQAALTSSKIDGSLQWMTKDDLMRMSDPVKLFTWQFTMAGIRILHQAGLLAEYKDHLYRGHQPRIMLEYLQRLNLASTTNIRTALDNPEFSIALTLCETFKILSFHGHGLYQEEAENELMQGLLNSPELRHAFRTMHDICASLKHTKLCFQQADLLRLIDSACIIKSRRSDETPIYHLMKTGFGFFTAEHSPAIEQCRQEIMQKYHFCDAPVVARNIQHQ